MLQFLQIYTLNKRNSRFNRSIKYGFSISDKRLRLLSINIFTYIIKNYLNQYWLVNSFTVYERLVQKLNLNS